MLPIGSCSMVLLWAAAAAEHTGHSSMMNEATLCPICLFCFNSAELFGIFWEERHYISMRLLFLFELGNSLSENSKL